MKKINVEKIDIKKILLEVALLFALGYISFYGFIGSFFVYYSELRGRDEIKFALLFGLVFWILLILCSFVCGVGFKRYLKREYRLAWIPVEKELPRNVHSYGKRVNYEKYLCLVEKEAQGYLCEIPVQYYGDGKWLSNGEDISNRVHAWRKSL